MANEAYHSSEYYRQQRSMLVNGDPRALICFCIDVSSSMNEWWIEDGGLLRTSGKGYSDGHNVFHFNAETDIKPGYAAYKKIDKLNDALASLLSDLKYDKDLRDKVAISIVVYSRFGKVLFDFLDCSNVDIASCRCTADAPETAMGDGIRTALSQIDEMEKDLRYAGKDAYTPLLIFMTDGTPTDDPRNEFSLIRERVQKGDLHVFPLGIGDGADMIRLRDMFPVGSAPDRYTERYKMTMPQNYTDIFQEIKNHIKQRQSVMVSEGNSRQSQPAIEGQNITNNQMGEAFDYEDLLSLM
ncbi:MAG: VWA domain-containing protein [Clostridia bacterium]|nr:VWA domain-containing protein [Clostridia bacterium]